jgi:hypothetical protein
MTMADKTGWPRNARTSGATQTSLLKKKKTRSAGLLLQGALRSPPAQTRRMVNTSSTTQSSM